MEKEVSEYIKNYELMREINFSSKFIEFQRKLYNHHYINSETYKLISDNFFKSYNFEKEKIKIEEFPYIPIELFKNHELLSIDKKKVFKIMRSSGTSGNKTSKIFLDIANAKAQKAALSKIFTDFTKLKRPGILICDNKETISKNKSFSARAAGILGFSSLCRFPKFILDEDMNLLIENIEELLSNNKIKEIILFGFTFIIWQHLLRNKLPNTIKKEFKNRVTLLHGGGWKKLESIKVSKEEFKERIYDFLGIEKCINYYGMVEQTGSIFMECEKGWLHENPLCRILARSEKNLKIDNEGIAQVISAIPTSYPGHSILTDDLVKLKGLGECSCGRKGAYFEIIGRLKSSETRGCSDTYHG
tara:strand:+ start:13659 stop:14738 length:1080 start_codon:yes stop_codon:yes gene_type:complete